MLTFEGEQLWPKNVVFRQQKEKKKFTEVLKMKSRAGMGLVLGSDTGSDSRVRAQFQFHTN